MLLLRHYSHFQEVIFARTLRTVTEITLLRAKRPKRWETGCARVQLTTLYPSLSLPRPLTRLLPHLVAGESQDLRGPPERNATPFYRLSHEPRRVGRSSMKSCSERPAGSARPAPVPCELALLQGFRLLDFPERLAEALPMLALKGAPDIRCSAPRLRQPVEHGHVAHAEDPLHLEHTNQQRVPARRLPLDPERCVPASGTRSRMRPPPAQAVVGISVAARRYSARVQQQMPELVRRREDPALHRNGGPRC